MWKHTQWCLLAPDANDGGAASSTEPAVATATADAKTTESSPVENAAESGRAALDTTLAAVLKKHEEAEPEEVTDGDAEDPDEVPAEEETDASAEIVEEGDTEGEKDDAEVPFHKHPRWKELQTKLKAAEADATRMSKIDSYCQQYGVTEEQVGQALEMAALLNNDPLEAYNRLQELNKSLASYAGDQLPADLEKAVKDGVVAPEYAKRMARLEAEVNMMKLQGQRGQQRSVEQQRMDMVKAINTWGQTVSGRDPDFARKQPLVEAQFAALVQKTVPRSVEQAVALADQAYVFVNKHLSGFVQAPARRAGPNGSSKKTLAEPKTPQEVVARVLRKYTH